MTVRSAGGTGYSNPSVQTFCVLAFARDAWTSPSKCQGFLRYFNSGYSMRGSRLREQHYRAKKLILIGLAEADGHHGSHLRLRSGSGTLNTGILYIALVLELTDRIGDDMRS